MGQRPQLDARHRGSRRTPHQASLSTLLPDAELKGLAGWAARLMDGLGEWGVGLFTLLETVFPPLPSEVILPLAGYLAQQGDMNVVLVVLTSTLGSYLGALVLYWLGATLGLERSIRGLSGLPLVERSDFERAVKWFSRHGRSSIFFGRLIPGVRSLISLPAGATRMPLPTFSLFTIAGTLVWSTVLIALGAALGTQYELVERYSRYLNYAVYAAVAVGIALLIVRRVRGRNQPAEGNGPATG
jgi:membrane protein DedA with SNARE-associated domain